MNEIMFRPSRAADAAAAAPLSYASGPDSFDYVFTTRRTKSLDFLRHALARPAGEFGYGVHVVGEWQGRTAASGGGWLGGLPGFARGTFASIFGFVPLLDTPAMLRRGSQAVRIMPDPAAGEYYIGHLGVDPGLRGRGFGEAMVRHLLAAARLAGARQAVLDVSIENPRAQALYERLGLRGDRDPTIELRKRVRAYSRT